MYWSDCSGPATIQTARIEDGGDQQILINDNEHSCIVSIAIDFNSRPTHVFLIQLPQRLKHISTAIWPHKDNVRTGVNLP